MTIAKIRKGNRITIPVEEMKKKQLSESDEVYFEVFGVVGRDITFQQVTGAYSLGSGIHITSVVGCGTLSGTVMY